VYDACSILRRHGVSSRVCLKNPRLCAATAKKLRLYTEVAQHLQCLFRNPHGRQHPRHDASVPSHPSPATRRGFAVSCGTSLPTCVGLVGEPRRGLISIGCRDPAICLLEGLRQVPSTSIAARIDLPRLDRVDICAPEELSRVDVDLAKVREPGAMAKICRPPKSRTKNSGRCLA
jgi:hypothetical protein